jgi:hypothetical protein
MHLARDLIGALARSHSNEPSRSRSITRTQLGHGIVSYCVFHDDKNNIYKIMTVCKFMLRSRPNTRKWKRLNMNLGVHTLGSRFLFTSEPPRYLH